MNTIDNNLNTTLKEQHTRRCRLRPWREIGALRRVGRVIWISVLGLWLLSVVQVLLGSFINPPFTPLMVQRFFQQLTTKDRPVHFERDYVSINDISPNLVTAVTYAEDGLFMYHHGFDVKQMKQAFHENKIGRRFRGGSTISQQTAKNAFLPHSRTMLRKAVEAYYTVMIEAVWSKRRIMEVYLNIVEFGDGIYGCEAASQHYFGHSADKLSRTEAAQLAASLPAPLLRNPAHQTPFFRRQVSAIKQRFGWGSVDLDMPKEKRRGKKIADETLWDFYKWYRKQK
ncbi:MAG: monofunctional biosynthetic peptidoglycan transglycosylase [Bacteroidales bacterium]|nr:monofunctional biosynthetic peptidoglycan transglycosylase [Bacteroidales bacterium]